MDQNTRTSPIDPIMHMEAPIRQRLALTWLEHEIESGELGFLNHFDVSHENQDRASELRQICREVIERNLTESEALRTAA